MVAFKCCIYMDVSYRSFAEHCVVDLFEKSTGFELSLTSVACPLAHQKRPLPSLASPVCALAQRRPQSQRAAVIFDGRGDSWHATEWATSQNTNPERLFRLFFDKWRMKFVVFHIEFNLMINDIPYTYWYGFDTEMQNIHNFKVG